MPPTLILDYSIHDPALTELGRRQCRDLRKNLLAKIPGELPVELIIVSPMIRTLETALIAFGSLVEQGVPIQAHASWQELTAKPCDIGSPIEKVAPMFPQVDFSQVDPVWPDKVSPAGAKYAYTKPAVIARGQSALQELYHRPEKVILVVSHSGFLRSGVTGNFYYNADYRIFDFAEPEGGMYKLKQWESTIKGGLGWSLVRTVPLGEGVPEDLSV